MRRYGSLIEINPSAHPFPVEQISRFSTTSKAEARQGKAQRNRKTQ